MRFGDNQILMYLFLLILTAIAFYIWAGIRYAALSRRFAEKGLLKKVAPSYNDKALRLRPILNITAILFIGIALARPQWGTYWKEKSSRGLDLLIALDVSKSMLAGDMQPDRISFAKAEIADFAKNLSSDRIGLMAFSGDAFLYCPLTMAYDGFILVLKNVNVGSVVRGGTSMSNLIDEAARGFTSAVSDNKILIIISDGEETEGDIQKAAEAAKKAGIKVFCVGIGTEKGAPLQYVNGKGNPIPIKDEKGKTVISRLEEDGLKRMAAATGGLYVRSTGSHSGLDAIYKQGLSKLEKLEREERLAKSYKERFQLPLAIALLALVTDMALIMANRHEKI